ncbi:hypothetical protein AnigIFM56816_000984 [Aspergillus niger]|nr:hypothetical protein AnigIFM56816_000984 [Aspergillus niger]
MSSRHEPRPQIVRRFTSELESNSHLATQIKAYQLDLDTEVEIEDRAQVYHIEHQISTESSFTGVEIARRTLQAKCDEFFKFVEEKEESGKRKPGVWRVFHRNDVERQLVQEIGNCREVTVSQVRSITDNLMDKWKASNSKVATNFIKICQNLDSHKQVFQCLSSQTEYTSALCGAVAMVIQASINYSSIAEQLSTYVSDLTERISICTSWLDLYRTAAMKERLSDIYEQYFDFFLKVASWYLKPKGSKILDSFNTNFTTGFQTVVSKIERSIKLLDDQAAIENAREIRGLSPTINWSTGLIMAQIQQCRKEVLESKRDNEVGRLMHNVLMQMDERMDRLERAFYQRAPEATVIIRTGGPTIKAQEVAEVPTSAEIIARPEAERLCQHLQTLIDHVGGSDGIESALQAGRLVAEPLIIRTLGKWTTSTSGDDLVLWIISPFEFGPQTSADLAVYGVIWSAIQAKAPFVSYVCKRPRPGTVPGFQGVEDKAAILSMAYSFILQLLQFQPPDDDIVLQMEMLDGLMQQGKRWSSALALLRYLLENTRSLRYIVISGINVLEGNALEMCREFVDTIFCRVRDSEWPLRVLFTTSGQSRALSETVRKNSKVFSTRSFRQKKGATFFRNLQMSG